MAAKQSGTDDGAFAGLATRDLRPWGGQRVAALDTFTAPLTLIHVGGVELVDRDEAFRAEVLAALREAGSQPLRAAC